jgi:hypothetical protein
MGAAVQVGGSLLILAAFVAAQVGRMETQSWSYLLLNAVGSTVLAIDAYLEEQWGFLLLETVWAIVSWWSIARKLRGREPTAAH